MFDRVIKIGSTFDWITPLITMIQDYHYRPSVGYTIPADDSWSAYAISDLLKEHGIKLWGLRIFQNSIMLRLRVAQAAYAQDLFEKNGIVYSGGIDANERINIEEPRKVQPKQKKTSGLLNEVTSAINRLADRLSDA